MLIDIVALVRCSAHGVTRRVGQKKRVELTLLAALDCFCFASFSCINNEGRGCSLLLGCFGVKTRVCSL